MAHLVVVHGVGGSKPASAWLEPLNARLAGLGYPRIEDPADEVHVADFGSAFGATTTASPETTIERQTEQQRRQAELEYVSRQLQIQRVARLHSEETWRVDADTLPRWMQDAAAFLMDQTAPFFREVKLFMSSDVVRDEACRLVAQAFPRSGSVVVIAHSLGSVVAARSLGMLPREVTIELFVTIGSPLSFERYRNRAGDFKKHFPYSRVKSWLNVYSPRDVVCAGRGISSAIEQAVDACARVAGSHDVRAYMSHPVVAAAVGHVLFDSADAEDGLEDVPTRGIDPSWFSDLLKTSFTYQIAEGWKSDHWDRYLRLQQARHEVARRATERLHHVEVGRAAEVSGNGPLAPGRRPTYRDLTDRSAQLLKEVNLKDDGLLVLAVALLLSPLVPPFDFEKWVDDDDRRKALVHTFNVVRDHGRGNLPDARFAQQITESLEWGRDRLRGGGFPFGRVLIGIGLTALAATGIGLTVAAPAGLTGAAAITATLAAFGPGGMMGGVATLAGLTGTAGVLTGIGVREELSGDGALSATEPRAGQVLLANLEIDELGSALVAMLAVVHAQAKLGLGTTEPETRNAISAALDDASAEHQLHQRIAPGTKGTDRLKRRIELLARALEALDELDLPHVKLRVAVREAVAGVRTPASAPTQVSTAEPTASPRPELSGALDDEQEVPQGR